MLSASLNKIFHSTFYLRLYDVRHMVKDHSDSERGNPLPRFRLFFPISSKGSFICTIPIDRIAHTTAIGTPVVKHWLEREIAQWVHHEGQEGRMRTQCTPTYGQRLDHRATLAANDLAHKHASTYVHCLAMFAVWRFLAHD